MAKGHAVADHDFVTSDGVRLHYVETGKGDAIVFVPGWRLPAFIWENQLDFFANSHRVIALDPRGHGSSEPTTEGFYKERRARDVHELLDEASVETAVLVGWSLGVAELLTYVQEFGTERVSALVLVDWPFRFDDNFRALLGQYMMRYLRDPEEFTRGHTPMLYSSPQDEDYLARIARASLAMPTSSAVAVMLDYIVDGGDWSSTLEGLDRPLLYTVIPELASAAEELSQLVPDAVIRVFDEAGHALFVDQHEEFNLLLLDFLEGIK